MIGKDFNPLCNRSKIPENGEPDWVGGTIYMVPRETVRPAWLLMVKQKCVLWS